MKNEKNKDISCHAKNCFYHCGETGCKADKIEVQTPDACSCRDTQCSTFKFDSTNSYT